MEMGDTLQQAVTCLCADSQRVSSDHDAFMLVVDGLMDDGFQQYLVDHLAIESLLFVRCVAVYKREFDKQTPQWRLRQAQTLIEQFVLSHSPHEVNISHKQRNSVIEAMERITNAYVEHLARDVIHLGEPEVMLANTFSSPLREMFNSAAATVQNEILYPNWIGYKLRGASS